MIRLMAVFAALAIALPSHAGRSGAMLEVSLFGSGAKVKTLHAWYEAWEKVKELDDEDPDAEDKDVQAKLKQARKRLKSLASSMGGETKVSYYINGAQARIDYVGKKTRTVVIRLDADKPYVLTWDNSSKVAKKTLLEKTSKNGAIKFNFDGMSGKTLKMDGETCAEYGCKGGGMRGLVYVAESDEEDAIGLIQEFIETSKDKCGGFKGELIWATLDQTQSTPMLGQIIAPSGGTRFDGTPSKNEKYGYVLRQVTFARKGDGEIPSLDPPKGYTVK